MARTHTPNHYSIAFVFGVAVLGIALILVWALVWNVGTLNVLGEYPFTVTVHGSEVLCEDESDCSFELSPREYSLKIEKEGYFDLQDTVFLSRQEPVEYRVWLKVIPFLKSFDGSLDKVAGPDGSWGKVYDYAWSELNESEVVYFSGQDLVFHNGELSEKIVGFQLVSSPLLAWNGGNFVAVNDVGVVTLVDRVKKRKLRLFDDSLSVSKMRWNIDGTKLLLEGSRGGRDMLMVYDSGRLELLDFTWFEPINRVVWSHSDRNSLLFVSDKEFVLSDLRSISEGQAVDFREVLDKAGRSLVSDLQLYRLDLLGDKASVVFNLRGAVGQVDRLFWNGKSLLLDDGERLREVVL
jgi:hypothetical protein